MTAASFLLYWFATLGALFTSLLAFVLARDTFAAVRDERAWRRGRR